MTQKRGRESSRIALSCLKRLCRAPCDARLQLPLDCEHRVGLVGAEEARLHRAIEVPAEYGALGLDPAHDRAHGPGDVQARPLGVRPRLARTPSEPPGAVELARQHLHLLAQSRLTADVVELLGLLELVAQLAEPRLVGTAGVSVEHLAGVPGAHTLGAAEIQRIELLAGMTQQLEEIDDALHVLEPREFPLAGNGPHIALVTEPRRVARRARWRGRRDRACRPRRRVVRRQPPLEGDEPEPRRDRGRLRFEPGGTLPITTLPACPQAAGELALRVGALWQSADPFVRRKGSLVVGDRLVELPEGVGEQASVTRRRAQAPGGVPDHDDGVNVRREEWQQPRGDTWRIDEGAHLGEDGVRAKD